MNIMNIIPIIMAGGLGKRMESDIPKVIHKIHDMPLIVHILQNLKQLNNTYNTNNKINIQKILIVVGKYKEQIKAAIDEHIQLPNMNIVYVKQDNPLGTGHAILCCKNELIDHLDSDVLILSGDVPMLQTNTMLNLINKKSPAKMIIAHMENPSGYGRIVTQHGMFRKIVEQNDCNEEEKSIQKVNTGMYCIQSKLLCKYVEYIKNHNKQQEYYLTDIIEIIIREENINIDLYEIDKSRLIEVTGVNTKQQLEELTDLIKKLKKTI
jgi:UDP-N-acetylglucosamine diphosphorylase/glucosamine-1-phosphate N-acetyltransferase